MTNSSENNSNVLRHLLNVNNAGMQETKVIAHRKPFDLADALGGFFIDNDYSVNTATHTYLPKLTSERRMTEVVFQEEVPLYPGGGLIVSHHIYVAYGFALYVKIVGWDS